MIGTGEQSFDDGEEKGYEEYLACEADQKNDCSIGLGGWGILSALLFRGAADDRRAFIIIKAAELCDESADSPVRGAARGCDPSFPVPDRAGLCEKLLAVAVPQSMYSYLIFPHVSAYPVCKAGLPGGGDALLSGFPDDR